MKHNESPFFHLPWTHCSPHSTSSKYNPKLRPRCNKYVVQGSVVGVVWINFDFSDLPSVSTHYLLSLWINVPQKFCNFPSISIPPHQVPVIYTIKIWYFILYIQEGLKVYNLYYAIWFSNTKTLRMSFFKNIFFFFAFSIQFYLRFAQCSDRSSPRPPLPRGLPLLAAPPLLVAVPAVPPRCSHISSFRTPSPCTPGRSPLPPPPLRWAGPFLSIRSGTLLVQASS